METIAEIIDDAKKRIEPSSDYELTKRLKLSRSAIGHAKKTGRISDETAASLAKILGRDEAELIAIANYWRAGKELRRVWEKISKLATASAAAILLFFMPFSDTSAKNDETAFYTLCVVIKRLLKYITLQPIHC